jgi:hypothetical protein
VEKIIQSSDPNVPEEAQIAIENADALHREIHIVNTLTKKNGDEVSLKKGATVKVTVEGYNPKASL